MKALAVIDVIDFPDYVYDNCPTKEQLDSITKKEDEWEMRILTGSVYIIDRYGTFEQHEEVSYDIMVDDSEEGRILFKHIRESNIL